MTQLHQNHC